MRIRQIKPSFFTDPDIAAMPFRQRLTYIGLWCACDDGGWFAADAAALGAALYPFDGRKLRERWITDDLVALQESGCVVIEECGHARIPTLPDHQRFGGRPVYTVRDAHARGCAQMRADARHGKVGNGRVGNGKEKVEGVVKNDAETSEFRDRLAALGVVPK